MLVDEAAVLVAQGQDVRGAPTMSPGHNLPNVHHGDVLICPAVLSLPDHLLQVSVCHTLFVLHPKALPHGLATALHSLFHHLELKPGAVPTECIMALQASLNALYMVSTKASIKAASQRG
jgi:hypothetical protein